jgi:SPP1 family predicted phage head-tail adaptor
MRAGDLDRVIEIQRRTPEGRDVFGTVTEVWVKVATMRAKVLQFATDDREDSRGHTTDTSITFRIRWLGVTLEDRVLYNGQAYTIRQIKELGRRVGLDLVCERVGP